jgi:ribosome-binding protein aMBF1 (putative translation factor)
MGKDKHIEALKNTNEQFERQIAAMEKDRTIRDCAPTSPNELEDFRRSLGEQLRDARVQHGYSRYHLSKLTKISEQQIKKLELGKLNVSINTLRTLTRELDIEVKI